MKSINIENSGVTNTDLANVLNVYLDSAKLRSNSISYNINRSLYFKDLSLVPVELFQDYTVVDGDEWTILSYKFYGTTSLWWLLCKINSVINPCIQLEEQTIIKVLKREYLNTVISALRV